MRKIKRFFRDIERWIAYRSYDKYHIVKTGLKPQYYDKDQIMLYANMSLLVDFVEHESSIENLKWASNLRWDEKLQDVESLPPAPWRKLMFQAYSARVYLKCYYFWKEQYLANHNGDLWELVYQKKFDGQKALAIEDFWEDLADKRLGQLMKFRRGLWT